MNAPYQPPQPNDKQDRARLILAIALSLAVLFGFNHFVEKPRREQQQAALQRQAGEEAQALALQVEAAARLETSAPSTPLDPARAVAETAALRIPIRNEVLAGSLSRRGLRLDDLSLLRHTKSLENDEPVTLLSPSNAEVSYYFESGWISGAGGGGLPTAETVWSFAPGSAREITGGGAPVILHWKNDAGLVFEREISLDQNYLFSIVDRVRNESGRSVTVNPFQAVARNSLPQDFSGFFVLHEGPIGAINGSEEKLSYADLRKGHRLEQRDAAGWLGFTDKYWLVAMLPSPQEKFHARIVGAPANGVAGPGTFIYQTDMVGRSREVAPGEVAARKMHLYAGVKDRALMHSYGDVLGVGHLDFAIDFGMWYFITVPFYVLLHWLFGLTGSVAAGILLMTVLIRLAVYPLASKAFRSMARMKVIAPQLKELQDRHKDDKAALQMAIFDLYRREKVNPFSGCWPILVQIPIFFALYKVLLLSVDLRHAPFWGWIEDMSAPDPTSIFNLFGLIPWDPPQLLMIGGWPILFCLTMIVQKRLSPPLPDPVQERIQGLFPYIFTVMLAHFASGLVIYWTWSNVLSILQQYYILKKVGGEDTSLIRGHAARRGAKASRRKKGAGPVIEGEVVDKKDGGKE